MFDDVSAIGQRTAGRSSLLASKSFLIFSAVAGLVVQETFALSIYRWYDRLLAWSLLIIFLLVCRRFAKDGAKQIPILPLMTLQFYVTYSFAQLGQDSLLLIGGIYVPPASVVTMAMLLAVGADLALLGGFKLAQWSLRTSPRQVTDAYPEPEESWRFPILLYAIACSVESFIANLRPDLLLADLRNVAFCVFNSYLGLGLLLWVAHRDRRAPAYYRTAAFAMVFFLSAVGMLSGMLEPFIVPLFTACLAAWMWGGGIRLRWVLVVIALFILLNPVKHVYRQAIDQEEEITSMQSINDRLTLWGDAISETWGNAFNRGENLQTVQGRTGSIIALAQAVDWVPNQVPYKQGAGMGTALLYFIPRFLWPGKPEISDLTNNRYALEFALTTPEGLRHVTIGIIQPIDGYWDFGLLGALLYPAILGAIIGVLFGNRSRRRLAGEVIGIVFCAMFFQLMAGLQMFIASIIPVLAGSWLAMRVLREMAGSTRLDVLRRESLDIGAGRRA